MRHLLTLRAAGGKLKVQHSIIDGLRNILERVLKTAPQIRGIIPGSIKPVQAAHGKAVTIRLTISIANGFKAIALAAGARQELFINTDLSLEALKRIFQEAGAIVK